MKKNKEDAGDRHLSIARFREICTDRRLSAANIR